MKQYISVTTKNHVEYVAAHMRDMDKEEVGAIGLSPLHALTKSYEESTTVYTLVEPDKTPCAIVGISPSVYGKDWGSIWMLGTKGIERHPMTFLRHSEPVLDALFKESGCTVLYNYVYGKNELHQKWLQWLGFRFLRKVELPPFNKEFIEFAKIRG